MNHNDPETIGILLMAYGSPESLDHIEDYLIDVRGGRIPSPVLVDEIKGRYEKIGGRSPLLERTTEQAEKLVEELNTRNQDNSIQYRGYVGMRHWEPRIQEAVQQMTSDGVKRAVSMVMAPHNSNMSIGRYYEALDNALEGHEIEINRILSWHIHPGLLNALAEKIEEAMGWFSDEPPYVIFTAHSLPTKIIE
ncbi:MAG: ferrochelatase, partial [Chloroflexi bacterium]|nr:ferrochelatase [Chloroflexota bacterium]